ncbi:hypothetical protein TUM12151_20290 [Morganella morganii]|nr:hypothetical protein TUM12149_03650 [Morganella morganii]GIZ32166.1 hypothetical protein TUM12150_26520 [Morganella morganii]GIZ35043.1 hypothetical protein TUM12151_20290 [Morganella morganii]
MLFSEVIHHVNKIAPKPINKAVNVIKTNDQVEKSDISYIIIYIGLVNTVPVI